MRTRPILESTPVTMQYRIRRYGEPRLRKELAFAVGFQHQAETAAERTWRLTLMAEATRRGLLTQQ